MTTFLSFCAKMLVYINVRYVNLSFIILIWNNGGKDSGSKGSGRCCIRYPARFATRFSRELPECFSYIFVYIVSYEITLCNP